MREVAVRLTRSLGFLMILLAAWWSLGGVALADDCSGPLDCYDTQGRIAAALAAAAGVAALLATKEEEEEGHTVRFVGVDGGELIFGEPFFLELEFKKEQSAGSYSVNLSSEGATQPVTVQRIGATTYRSDPLLPRPPDDWAEGGEN